MFPAFENPAPSFCCTICGRSAINRWRQCGRFRHIEPVCSSCEGPWQGRVFHGDFMDRRILMQINALTQQLETEAKHAKYAKL